MIQFTNALLLQLVSPNKVDLRTASGQFKKRFYKINKCFKKKSNRNNTAIGKNVWNLNLKHNVTSTLKWYILKSVTPYSNITKKCRLCLHEKFEILSYPNPDELLEKYPNLIQSATI